MKDKHLKSLRIFIAYTSDCKAERDAVHLIVKSDPSVIYLSRKLGVAIDISDWAQVFPDLGRPQSLINSEIKEFLPHWVIFLFWHRFGTDAGKSMTGIEEEWSLAKKLHEEGDGYPHITAYFNNENPPAFQANDEQQNALSKFRKNIITKHEALVTNFNHEDKFEEIFRGHLTTRLMEHSKDRYEIQSNKLKELFWIASQDLACWPTSLPDGKWIDRKELREVEQKITSCESSTTLVLGGPGSGKSAFLAKLTRSLADNGIVVLAIKADFLSTEIKNNQQFAESLGFPMSTISCLETISTISPVVLLIDQLDAVADLVDLHSERLNILLDLINSSADKNNIHVIASCREFEHNHDPRLRNIDMDIVQLEPPSWESISEILTEYEYRTDGWPIDFKDILRIPQNLQIFLDITVETDEYSTVLTYQSMLDKLWESKVVKKGIYLTELLDEMSIRMGETEELWLPLVRYQKQLLNIEYLEAEGILVRQNNGKKIGFRHQTLFEYSRARAFISKEGSLSKFVLARQDALFVRPQLWNALSYLRESDSYSYKFEFESLWYNKTLRPHLKILLVEYLGLLQRPEDYEVIWLISELDNKRYTRRIFTSVVGSQGWFLSLAKHYIPRYMVGTFDDSMHVLMVLRSAWKYEPDRVRDLIKTYWITNLDKDKLTWDVLRGNEKWIESDIELGCVILSRTNLDLWSLGTTISELSNAQPELAPKLFSAYLKYKLETAKQDPELEEPKLSDDADIGEMISHQRKYDYSRKYNSILEGGSGIHDLPAIAEASPKIFIDEVWDIFIEIIKSLKAQPHEFVVGYSTGYHLSTDLEDDRDVGHDYTIVKSFEIAIVEFAKQDSSAFLNFLSKAELLDILLVQRYLARGLKSISNNYPNECLKFLLADPRRLILGNSSDSHLDSKALISETVPYLSTPQRLSLEKSIREWSMYKNFPDNDGAQANFDRRKYNREHRLRLLKAFPREYMSPATLKYLTEEERAFPNFTDWDMRHNGASFVGSRISCEQMKKANDPQLLKLFSEINDKTGWDHPRDHKKGGIIQLSREFEKLAKDEPQRVIKIIRQLEPGVNEIAVGHAIDGIAQTDTTLEVLFDEIRNCITRGFSSKDFRRDIADALDKSLNKNNHLPDEFISLLESWLSSVEQTDSEKKNNKKPEDREYDSSVLWGHGHSRMLPAGNYPILRTIVRACLLQEPPNTTKLQNILYEHLNRDENEDVWESILVPFFQYLDYNTSDGDQDFLNSLFLKYPNVICSIEGVMLIAQVQSRVSDTVLKKLLFLLRESGNVLGEQGYGEILCIYHIIYQDNKWASKLLWSLIESRLEDTDQKAENILVGIAYSAANMSKSNEYRKLATEIIVKLIKMDRFRIYNACSDMFRVLNEFIPDETTWSILDALADFPPTMDRGTHTSFLIEHLEPLVTIVPNKVYEVCLGIIKKFENNENEIYDSYSINSEVIISISFAMQRMAGDYRKKGLDLFERLLILDTYDAKRALVELDRRPLIGETTRPRRRRRRKKKST